MSSDRDSRAETPPEARSPGREIPGLEVAGGAAAGALIGRLLAGGTWGVAIGAALGAIAGSAVSTETRRRPSGSPRHGERPERERPERERPERERPAGAPARPPPGATEEPLESWTKARLYERAKELDIAGRSRMSKAELIGALRGHPDFSPA